ncbi:MAG: hypothetical protein N3A38_02075 [Planctomycetota bacterium]|nr:hypothetical protein [Planctomycetota bacterium]
MRFLANHAEKLIFAAVVLVCLYVMASESGADPEEKAIRDSLEAKRNAIESALRDNVPPRQKDPTYEETVSRTLAGPAAAEIQAFAPRSAYPLLPRPKFPEKVVEIAKPEAEAIAVLRAPINVEAAADRGRVYVSWEPSPENQFVATVRAILDVSADGGATWKEAAVEEFSPEDATAAEKKDDKTQKPQPAVPEEERRRPRRGEKAEEGAEAPRGDKAKPGAGRKLTEQDKFKNKYVFLYQGVEPKKTYQFRVRQVCRLTAPPKGEKLREPEGCVKLKSKSGKTDLFESRPSAVVSATTPPDVEIRFAGSVGEKGQEGYMANFEVRKWDPKIRNWRKGMARVGIGEEIAVIVRFRNEETKTTEVVELKSGYRLTDVENVEVSVIKEVEEILTEEVPVKDEDGNPVVDEKTKKPVTERKPVLDPKTGQPVKVKREKEMKIPSQFAVLTETATGKVEKIEKREDFEARQQFLQYLEQVLKEREEEKAERTKKAQ